MLIDLKVLTRSTHQKENGHGTKNLRGAGKAASRRTFRGVQDVHAATPDDFRRLPGTARYARESRHTRSDFRSRSDLRAARACAFSLFHRRWSRVTAAAGTTTHPRSGCRTSASPSTCAYRSGKHRSHTAETKAIAFRKAALQASAIDIRSGVCGADGARDRQIDRLSGAGCGCTWKFLGNMRGSPPIQRRTHKERRCHPKPMKKLPSCFIEHGS